MTDVLAIPESLEQKLQRWARITPQLLVKWLEKKLAIDKLLHLIESYRDVKGIDFVNELVKYFRLHLDVSFKNEIPAGNRYIFVSNHPIGALDGVAFIAVVHKYFGQVKAIVNEFLLMIRNLQPVFIGINVYGRFGRKHLVELSQTLSGNSQIIMFPAGAVSRRREGKIIDLPWHKSFVKYAVNYKRDVVPVLIKAQNSDFFYRLLNLRERLNLRFPLETLFLAREIFNYFGKTIKFVFGKPIPYSVIAQNPDYTYWAQTIRQQVYDLDG